jgi:hypothetical protein
MEGNMFFCLLYFSNIFKAHDEAKKVIIEDLELPDWSSALKQYGKDLETGLQYWAEPLKKLSAGLKKSEKGIYTRPTNYLKWIDRLKTHSGNYFFLFLLLNIFLRKIISSF